MSMFYYDFVIHRLGYAYIDEGAIMGQVLRMIVIGSILFTFIVVVPTALVLPARDMKETDRVLANDSSTQVSVVRSEGNSVEKVELEEYVVGVVASEMPADFEMEALKAQAVAARTYVMKSLKDSNEITDTTKNQVYQNLEDLKEVWQDKYEEKLAKIQEAVNSTAGQVITYEGELITASFFSTSNGYTESAKDVWGEDVPYLQSVASPWDKDTKKFLVEEVLSVSDVEQKLGISISDGQVGTIISYTEGNRIKEISFGEKILTGKEVREKLGIRSADFNMEKIGDEVTVTTRGYGHGVGMSQYGANALAQNGKSYEDILHYYYSGIEIDLYGS